MFHVFLQPAPSGTPMAALETARDVSVYLEEWCRNEAESPSGFCPCVSWHDCGTETVSDGTD
jgi:hypothetical protein